MEVNYMRQAGMFDPTKAKHNYTIIGAGSLGSLIAWCMAQLGINNIRVIDFDEVEPHNIPNQIYGLVDCGKPKVEALKEIIKRLTDIDIEIINDKITDKTELEVDLDSVYISALDSLEVRRLVYSKLKGAPILLLDPRMGGEQFSIKVCDLGSEESQEKYERTLEGEGADLPCGMQSIFYTVMNCATEVVNIIKKIENGEPYPTNYIRNMRNYNVINNYKEEQDGI